MNDKEMIEQYLYTQVFLDVIEELYPDEFEKSYEEYKLRNRRDSYG